MFHFSTDRLAGLDNMILRITAPPKVPSLITSHSFNHDAHIPVRKPEKQKSRQETRPPLVDKTASNNLAARPPYPARSMLLHAPSTAGGVQLLCPQDSSSPQALCSPYSLSFRPLPPLPSASALHLPSFLNLSTESFGCLVDPVLCHSAATLPASAAFRVPSSPDTCSRRVVARKTRNNKVIEGPQWIPAFHHPNSPYVPWPSPVRRRILPPMSPLSPSPLPVASPCIRSGAVAPVPWASSTFSQPHDKFRKERLPHSWKSFRNTVKKGVKTVLCRLGRSTKSLRMLCTGQGMLRTYDATDTVFVEPHLSSDAMRATSSEEQDRGSRHSLASFVSSDSETLVAWLAERRATASCVSDNNAVGMSVEEYELMGSWLDLRHCDGGWLCGIQDCDMHTAGGSPCVANEHPNGLHTAMPFDSTDMSPRTPALLFPPGPFSAPLRFYSLPRFPCQSFDVHSAQEAEPMTVKNTKRRTARCRERSMPGGWTF